MNQLVSKQVEYNKQLCDAFGCEEIATEIIGVSVGNYGVIELNLCKNCISKFEDNST